MDVRYICIAGAAWVVYLSYVDPRLAGHQTRSVAIEHPQSMSAKQQPKYELSVEL